MIIYHAGLPRSGKSFECLVRRIIPALKAGRQVDAYVEGLNFERIAECAELPVERVRELLRQVTRDEVPQIHTIARDNALVVIDEVQNFFGQKAKLDAGMTQFVTEHGHRGMDIVLMGQDVRDTHVLFRRRIEIKQSFLKLSAVGAEGFYRVVTERHEGNDKYVKVGSERCRYDKAYFGTYASHTGSDIQTANYQDARANVFGGAFWIRAVLLGLLAIGAAWYVVRYFSGGAIASAKKHGATAQAVPESVDGVAPVRYVASKVVPPVAGASAPGVATATATAAVGAASAPLDSIQARLDQLGHDGQIRLAGLMQRQSGEWVGVVEWVERGGRVLQRLTVHQLESLGVKVRQQDGMLYLDRGTWSVVAMMWPVEPVDGQITQPWRQAVAGKQPG